MITLPSQVGPNQERDLGVSMERSSEDKGKEPWLLYSSQIGRGGPPPLMGAGFSWPPRSYFCSFCKREFKSAQALGGHMNVHRRDRARLRQSPPLGPFPLFDLNPNPNPNPNLLRACPNPPITTTSSPPNLNLPPPPSSPPPAKLLSLSTTTSLPFISSPLTHFSAAAADLNTMEYFTVKDFLGEQAMNTDLQTKAAREIVRLDLEIGSFEDHNKDHVDLELRLGYI